MPSLLDKYKEYKQKLVELIKAYKKLEESEIAVKFFLERERGLYNEREQLQLSLAMPKDNIEKLRLKEVNLEFDSKENISSEKKLELQQKLAKVSEELKTEEKKIEKGEEAVQVLEHHIPWLKNEKLEIDYVRKFVEPKKFHAYIDAIDEVITIGGFLEIIQCDLKNSLEQENKEENKLEAIEWAKKHIRPLTQEQSRLHEQLMSQFNYRLQAVYHKAAEEYLRYLDGKKYEEGFKSGQYHLDDLERFVAKRRKNQSDYRKALPDYVRELIGNDVHIKGQRIIGRTNTGEKVSKISEFLEKPFNSAEKASDLKRLKDLFEAISVHFVDTEIEQLYNAAIQQKQKLAGPEEKGAPPPKLS